MRMLNTHKSYLDTNHKANSVYRLCIFVIIALLATIIPMPSALASIRPNFVLILILYIQCFFPKYLRVSWVFVLGLLLDVLTASVIGKHSLALIVTSWALKGRPSNFKYYSTLQQMSIIFIYCVLYQLVIVLIDLFFALGVSLNNATLIALLSVALWPVLKYLNPV